MLDVSVNVLRGPCLHQLLLEKVDTWQFTVTSAKVVSTVVRSQHLVRIRSKLHPSLFVGIIEKVELAVATHLSFLVLTCYKFILAFWQGVLVFGGGGAQLRGGAELGGGSHLGEAGGRGVAGG